MPILIVTNANMSTIKLIRYKIKTITLKQIIRSILTLYVALIAYCLFIILQSVVFFFRFDKTFYTFIAIGFCAQLIDGPSGMAYGASSSSLLLHFGVSPKIASASVHMAEVSTTGVSGLAHLKSKNIDKKFLIKLVVPGVIGAVVGAYLLSAVLE